MAIIAPQNQNNQQEQQQTAPTPQTSAATPSAPSATPMPSANQPKGSGRFTNIQKYIGANQGAGQRLAGGVEKRVQSQVNPNVEKAQSQASQIAEQVNKAQGELKQGQQLQQQVANKNFDALGFINQGVPQQQRLETTDVKPGQVLGNRDPITGQITNLDLSNFGKDNLNPTPELSNLERFTQFRTGQAIDENALRGQAEQAQIQAQQAQQQAQQFGQQLGTEQGRQQLLKQTFSPTRNYTVGQQRLDNLFLQQASPQLRNLSQNLNLTQQQLGNLGTQAEQKRQAIQDLAGQEQELAQGLTTAIGAREQDVVGAAEARQKEVNDARIAAQEQARLQYQNLLEGKGIDKQFAENLGIDKAQSLYNVLKDKGNIDDYIKFNPTLLQGANQLASQEQRQKYDAIARLAGLDPSQRRIGLEDKTQAAVDFNKNLGQRVSEADKQFRDMIAQTQVYGAPTAAQAQQIARNAPVNIMDPGEYYRTVQGGNLDSQSYGSYAGMARGMAQGRAYNNALQQRAQANLGDIVGSIENLGQGQIKQDNQALIDAINNRAMGTMQEQTGDYVTDQARNLARSQIQQDVLRRLAESGYFNRVNINEPT